MNTKNALLAGDTVALARNMGERVNKHLTQTRGKTNKVDGRK